MRSVLAFLALFAVANASVCGLPFEIDSVPGSPIFNAAARLALYGPTRTISNNYIKTTFRLPRFQNIATPGLQQCGILSTNGCGCRRILSSPNLLTSTSCGIVSPHSRDIYTVMTPCGLATSINTCRLPISAMSNCGLASPINNCALPAPINSSGRIPYLRPSGLCGINQA